MPNNSVVTEMFANVCSQNAYYKKLNSVIQTYHYHLTEALHHQGSDKHYLYLEESNAADLTKKYLYLTF